MVPDNRDETYHGFGRAVVDGHVRDQATFEASLTAGVDVGAEALGLPMTLLTGRMVETQRRDIVSYEKLRLHVVIGFAAMALFPVMCSIGCRGHVGEVGASFATLAPATNDALAALGTAVVPHVGLGEKRWVRIDVVECLVNLIEHKRYFQWCLCHG